MREFAVLVGIGANRLEIPALVFGDFEEAKQTCEKLLGVKAKSGEGGSTYFRLKGDEEDQAEVCDKVYTEYNYGSGECYEFELRRVQEGKPFVIWDLD